MIISIEKGSYGQWVITAEIDECFISKQYYFYSKKEAVALAKQEIKDGLFDQI